MLCINVIIITNSYLILVFFNYRRSTAFLFRDRDLISELLILFYTRARAYTPTYTYTHTQTRAPTRTYIYTYILN